MWFIANIFERYTTSFANACMKIAVAEADATRRALENLRSRRDHNDRRTASQDAAQQMPVETAPAAIPEPAPEPEFVASPAPAPEPVLVTAPAEPEVLVTAPVEPEPLVTAPAEPEPVAVEAVAAPAAIPPATAMPMGVRGDVVVRWLKMFAEAERRQMPDLIEALRKDKKVRVPELQMICAEALGEVPQHRKKGEHLDVLRRHFVPSERARATAADEARPTAN